MGSRFAVGTPHQARAILNTRDYDHARRRLSEALGQPGWLRDESRIEALSLALAAFERRILAREPQVSVEWAECVFIPALGDGNCPRRRWSDPRPHTAG
ncbi:MAG: hypothetical protein IT532_11950 [Burkholderiales bacterium]|nr:hypothetical protein [Burkholderiales bacterium]